jgi:hypothetical protein
MEPITICGAVIVAFGLWVEFEAAAIKSLRALSRSAIVTTLLSLTKEQRPVASTPLNACRSYRTGSGLSYRVARS